MAGYVPLPPPQQKIHHTLPPISVADDATFDQWIALPDNDHRTLEEFAANPVQREFTWEYVYPPLPPPPLNRR